MVDKLIRFGTITVSVNNRATSKEAGSLLKNSTIVPSQLTLRRHPMGVFCFPNNPFCYNQGMNKRWHDRHKVPSDSSDRDKLKWHQKHQKACGCRPIPNSLVQRVAAEREARAGKDLKK